MANGIRIDKERLYAAFKARGLTLAKASRACGFHDNYFSSAAYDGYMGRPTVILLESLYGIQRTEYELADKPAPAPAPEPAPEPTPELAPEPVPEPAPAPAAPEPEPPAPPALDYDRLSRIIYDAVYLAVKNTRGEV